MLYEPYYTSRCIHNKLYVIASGNLRKEDNRIVTYYSEDLKQKEIGFDNIKYLKDIKTKKQTLISISVKTKGRTINQYSVDEYENCLRLAIYDNSGSRVVIFDKNLNEIGKTQSLAKGEKMYSSRFMGNKAYLVTYKTIDPLYVINLSDCTNPQVLGELKIPGYSTYLHPYDENYLIGIGMETEEMISKDSNGRVISTTAKVVGMKMTLFDVGDVHNPIQMSSVVIGDSRTTSAILTNPKALLFSKEKELLAIPVNNYAENFSVNNSTDYSSMIRNYTSYEKTYLSEGYAIYKINLTEGIQLKGMLTHNGANEYTGYHYRTNSKLLRGLYIDGNLYTVSENQVKVNRLDTLKLLSEIDLKERKKESKEIKNQIDSKNSITSQEKNIISNQIVSITNEMSD